jgi:hypothetical protein
VLSGVQQGTAAVWCAAACSNHLRPKAVWAAAVSKGGMLLKGNLCCNYQGVVQLLTGQVRKATPAAVHDNM